MWKRRNIVVFYSVRLTLRDFTAKIRDEAMLWSHHLRTTDRWVIDKWCSKLRMDSW
jgi:hypothetical protein